MFISGKKIFFFYVFIDIYVISYLQIQKKVTLRFSIDFYLSFKWYKFKNSYIGYMVTNNTV